MKLSSRKRAIIVVKKSAKMNVKIWLFSLCLTFHLIWILLYLVHTFQFKYVFFLEFSARLKILIFFLLLHRHRVYLIINAYVNGFQFIHLHENKLWKRRVWWARMRMQRTRKCTHTHTHKFTVVLVNRSVLWWLLNDLSCKQCG